MSNQRAVIFDLDDTLYAESEFVKSGFIAVANWAAEKWGLNVDVVAKELRDLSASASHGRVFNEWLDQHRITDNNEDSIRDMVRVYREHAPSITPFPEARPTIEKLKPSYRIGLISDGYLLTQQNKFNALKLADLFDAVVFSDAFGRENWKPSSVPYETVKNQLSVASRNCIYIGDNPAKDFLGARRAGMMSIRLRMDFGVYSELEPESSDYAADLEISHWSEVVASIQRLFNSRRDS